jgi:hypothetical protein
MGSETMGWKEPWGGGRAPSPGEGPRSQRAYLESRGRAPDPEGGPGYEMGIREKTSSSVVRPWSLAYHALNLGYRSGFGRALISR